MEPSVIGTLIFLVCVVITGYGNGNLGFVSHITNIDRSAGVSSRDGFLEIPAPRTFPVLEVYRYRYTDFFPVSTV